jgi:RNA-binding protein 25
VDQIVADIQRLSSESGAGAQPEERFVIPPHLHDLQEAELPEAQRGLVISEIAMFRERAAIRERDRARAMRDSIPTLGPQAMSAPAPAMHGARPQREWGRPQPDARGAVGSGPQGYDRPVDFVQASSGEDSSRGTPAKGAGQQKTDEQLESERKEQRRRDEENSFRDVRALVSIETHADVDAARTPLRAARADAYCCAGARDYA